MRNSPASSSKRGFGCKIDGFLNKISKMSMCRFPKILTYNTTSNKSNNHRLPRSDPSIFPFQDSKQARLNNANQLYSSWYPCVGVWNPDIGSKSSVWTSTPSRCKYKRLGMNDNCCTFSQSSWGILHLVSVGRVSRNRAKIMPKTYFFIFDTERWKPSNCLTLSKIWKKSLNDWQYFFLLRVSLTPPGGSWSKSSSSSLSYS